MATGAEEFERLVEQAFAAYGLENEKMLSKRGLLEDHRVDVENEVIQKIKDSGVAYDLLSTAQQKALLEGKKQNALQTQTLRTLQEQKDSILGLTREQNASIEALKKETNLRQIQADSTTHQGAKITAAYQQMSSASGILSTAQNVATSQFGATAAGAMGVNLAFTALNTGLEFGTLAFNQWKEGLDNAFQAQMAYNTQLVLGADGYKLANMQQLSKMKLDAKQTREYSDLFQTLGFGLGATSIGLVALRSTSIGAALGLGAMSLPVTLVVAGLTALAALFGLKLASDKYIQAQAEEKAATDLENATTLKDKLYDTYMDIGKAGLVGSQGITALTENAHKAGFALKDIDKFTSVLKNSQKEMSMFAGGAAAGVDKFASVTGEMTAKLGDHFRNL